MLKQFHFQIYNNIRLNQFADINKCINIKTNEKTNIGYWNGSYIAGEIAIKETMGTIDTTGI